MAGWGWDDREDSYADTEDDERGDDGSQEAGYGEYTWRGRG